MPDPFADPLEQLGLPPQTGFLQQRQRQMPLIPSLMPEEEDAFLSRIGSMGISGLSWLAGILNKPGRAVRGVLGGEPSELLNLVPFSDAMGLTDPTREVTGADLIGQPDATFFSPEGLAGFGVDVATDPLTYLTLGGAAVNRAGRVAKNIGVLPKGVAGRAGQTLGQAIDAGEVARQALRNESRLVAGADAGLSLMDQAKVAAQKMGLDIDDLLGQRMGGVVGFRPPFMNNLGVLGASDAGAGLAQGVGNLLGRAAGVPGIRQTLDVLSPAVRSLKGMFQTKYMDQVDPALQQVMPGISQGIKAGEAAARQRFADIVQEANALGLTDRGGGDLIRGMLEGTVHGPHLPAVEAISGKLSGLVDDAYKDYLHWGGKPTPLQDSAIDYFPRYLNMDPGKAPQVGRSAARRALTTAGLGELSGREEFLKNIQGGTGTINEIIADAERLNAMTPLAAAADIRGKYLGMTPDDVQRMNLLAQAVQAGVDVTTPDGRAMLHELSRLKDVFGQSQQLADYVRTTVPRLGVEGFTSHPAADAMAYSLARNQVANAQRGMYQVIKNTAVDAGSGTVPVTKLLDDAGITGEARYARLAEALGVGAEEAVTKHVPREIYEAATRYMQTFSKPETLAPIIDAWDYASNLFRLNQTSYWPAFHVRNLMTGLYTLGVEGSLSKGTLGQAYRTLTSPDLVPGLSQNRYFQARGLDDVAATKALRSLAVGHSVIGQHAPNYFTEVGGAITRDVTRQVPGLHPQEIFSRTGTSRNPLSIDPDNMFFPIAAGRKVGNMVEEVPRLAGFLHKLDQGMSPQVAAAQIRAALVDYKDLTRFEKSVMRRIAPFYTFSRHNIPYQLKMLAENPGGATATLIKGIGRTNEEPGFVPSYISQSGAATPIGPADASGTRRFMTQLGLPFEDLAEKLSTRGVGGMLSPYVKLPIETLSGVQLHSGRELRDLYSRTGIPALDEVLMNSPVSRITSTALSTPVSDPRKSWLDWVGRMGTGVRFTDADINKAKDISVRDWLDDQLRGPEFRRFQRVFVRPEDLANLSPAEMDLYRLYLTRERAAARQRTLVR